MFKTALQPFFFGPNLSKLRNVFCQQSHRFARRSYEKSEENRYQDEGRQTRQNFADIPVKESRFKGNFKRDPTDWSKDRRDFQAKDIMFREERIKFEKESGREEMHDKIPHNQSQEDDERAPRQIAFSNWADSLKKYKDSQRTPNFLTWEVKEEIRRKHTLNPEVWTIEKISGNYPVSRSAVKQVLKNKWTPRNMIVHDKAALKNWEDFKSGKITLQDELLQTQLMSFVPHELRQNKPGLTLESLTSSLEEAEENIDDHKSTKVIQVHKEKLEVDIQKTASVNERKETNYPEKIAIPASKFKEGATYRINDCYYHSDGTFLFRVPGMTKANQSVDFE